MRRVVVIGLGVFGFNLVKILYGNGFEVVPPASFYGKTIRELHLRSNFHVEVIAVEGGLPDRIKMVPRADFLIKGSDILIVIGKTENIQNIK